MNLTPATTPNSAANSKGLSVSTQEVERKWLVTELPDLTGLRGKEVIQGYIAVTPDGTEVRVRQKGDRYFQTIKSDGGLVRGEIEIELTKVQYDDLWQATAGRRLEKTRYEIALDEATIELDVYKGVLTGLIVAEVEFPSVRDSEKFSQPAWFGREVTEDKRYKNKNLALNGFSPNA
jgi:CYTH domain-containing protein